MNKDFLLSQFYLLDQKIVNSISHDIDILKEKLRNILDQLQKLEGDNAKD